MTDGPIGLPADEPPRSGLWVDIDEVVANPTDGKSPRASGRGRRSTRMTT